MSHWRERTRHEPASAPPSATDFNILRNPNPHLGFGGNGAHYCIGANLARMEINLMFNAIADILPDIAKLGEPNRLRHGWIHGVKDLPVRYNPPATAS